MAIVIDPDSAPVSGVTLDDLIARVKQELSDRENLNVLSNDLDEVTDVLQFKYGLENIVKGSLVSVDDEVMYVFDSDIPSKTAIVRRGHQGDSATHSAGTVISSGGVSRRRIIDSINDEIVALNGFGIYQMRSTPLLPALRNGSLNAYLVTALNGSNVYDVQGRVVGSGWERIPGWRYNAIDTTVTLPDSWFWPSLEMRVVYKAPFAKLQSGSDDLQSAAGVQSEAEDVLVWGACYRLTGGDEYKRNDFRTQGDPKRAEEVPYRAVALARQDFKSLRDERRTEEKARFLRHFPTYRPGS